MYVAGSIDGRWRIEKRWLRDGELVVDFGDGGAVEPELSGAASAIVLHDDVPRAPECASRSTIDSDSAQTDPGQGCSVRVASSRACAATNVRASTQARSGEDW